MLNCGPAEHTDGCTGPAPTNEIVARQIGNIQCNINRLQIVTGLAKLQGTLGSLIGEVSSYVFPSAFLRPRSRYTHASSSPTR